MEEHALNFICRVDHAANKIAHDRNTTSEYEFAEAVMSFQDQSDINAAKLVFKFVFKSSADEVFFDL